MVNPARDNGQSGADRGKVPSLKSADELRRLGHLMVDYIVDYVQSVEGMPVRSQVSPGYLRPLLPDTAPEHGESLAAILKDVDEKIMPGITHWQHPAFFAYFSANTSAPSVVADMLCNALGCIGFSWIGSPALTELEAICMDWLARLLHLPPCFLSTQGPGGGVIQGSASDACLVSLLGAKARALEGRAPEDALRLVAYTSDQAHVMVRKNCQVAGIPRLRLVPSDPRSAHSMRAGVLEALIQRDLEEGLLPFWLCGTVGTTSSCAVDPLEELGAVARRHGLWFHVDAAWAGVFSLLPEVREEGHFRGLELADSFDTNPHKGLLTNFDCSAMWVRDATWIKAALSLTPEYLKAQGNTLDYKDWQVPLGRRFRALKLWFVLRMYGAQGLQGFLRERLYLQELFVKLVAADARFEIMAPPRFGLVCFRLRGASDDESAALLEAVNASGRAFLTHTTLGGRHIIRMAIGSVQTQARHIEDTWALIQEAAGTMQKN